MSSKGLQFAAGERVLCYHGPLVYEAKVLKAEYYETLANPAGGLGAYYYVHYKGWKQTWDEWVPSSRLLKFTEENLALQKKLQADAAALTQSAASTSKAKAATGKDAGRGGTSGGRKEGMRGTKRGREEDDGTRKPEMKLTVPDLLRVKLVDDWEKVTRYNELVPLPRSPNVEEILKDFHAYVLRLQKPPPKAAQLMPTIVSGLQLYFDKSLGANLLYRFERPQYAEQRKLYQTGPKVQYGKEKDMSAVYGAEHLLRMIVSLPSMVANSTMDPESVNILKDYVHELLNYMMVERNRLFVSEYETASAQYQNLARA